MEKKFERLSWTEIGIISFMGLVLLISLAVSWHKKSQTSSGESTIAQQAPTIQKKATDTLIQEAENAVIVLEGTQTEEKLLEAQFAVNKLKDVSKKEALQKRINQVKELVGQQTDSQKQAKLKAELAKAEAAKKLEEQKKTAESETEQSTTTSEKETRRQGSYSVPVQNTYRGQQPPLTTENQQQINSSDTSTNSPVESSETAPAEESVNSSASIETETTPQTSETSETEHLTAPNITTDNP
ncbi:serine protease [Streptococcus ruminantium]|uniref:Serine protease n=1 Tax=Streptococcus ruminantium TaxID=1917441 RepID=A0ABU1B0Y7_9STRE|nr:serine protease [Streptococcus ruminantium]MDQ8759151.1 serine protease [Streptococcus ruminantium]MDQ8768700.1 serine protease [Streptococcus ruminantium]MDQ8775634.1 serine protease [Streptococcus ruminantium]MDQ8795688.1 serine protease [Streptococcus ruminantium]MDQ8806362.1 serine protease [Streptococcus ruminantium]